MAVLFWACVAGVFYVYAGYPLLLALLSRFRSEDSWDSSATPEVTLLIAAYREEAALAAKLDDALKLDYPRDRLQILVALDGDEDASASRVHEFADRGVELCHSTERQGKMAAINRAMQFARGEIIVFSDANNHYTPDSLRRLVAPFAHPRVGGVAGAKHIATGDGALGASEGLYWKYEGAIKRWESRLGSCIGAPGEIFALRRELFEAPPADIINDDFYLASRLLVRGWRVVYEPEAKSFERVSATASDEVRRRARINSGRFQALLHASALLPVKRPLLAWQMISHKFARPLVPLLMIGAALSNLVLAFGSTRELSSIAGAWPWVMLGLQVEFYLAAAIGGFAAEGTPLRKLCYLPRFLVTSNWAALQGLVAFIRQEHNPLWERVTRRAESAW